VDLGSLAFAAAGASEIGVLILVSFLPPVIWVVWIRNTEKYGREPWGMIIGMFLWGAIFAVIIGAILSLLFLLVFEAATPVEQVLARRFSDPATILVALVIAPFTEEFAKAFGVLRRSFVIREPEDGFVYGATSGLGFSATENLLYGILAFTQVGFAASLVVIAVRSVSSSFLHASATSLTGYGIARHRLWGPRFSAIPWYLAAVAMHAAFNALASFGIYLGDLYGGAGVLLVLAGGIVFAFAAISVVRGKIMEHDARQGWVP
jgi:RsiW-degrading membrane proteinase PrsW (M82 family)